MGIAKTINDGLREVKGKYVGFISSDDLWVKDKLEKELEILGKNEGKIVWADAEVIDGKGVKSGKRITELLNAPREKSGNLFSQLLKEQFVFGQTMLVPSAFMKDFRFDEELKYVNDHRFIVDLAANHEFIFMPEPLAQYRIHGGNTTNKDEMGWLAEKILLRKYFIKKYESQISKKDLAELNYKIGYFLTREGKRSVAKHYYLEALKTDYWHVHSVLYLVLALTGGRGKIGVLLEDSYYAVNSKIKKVAPIFALHVN